MELLPRPGAVFIFDDMHDLHSPSQAPHATILFGVLISPNLSPASASPSAQRHDLSFLLALDGFHQVRDESAVYDPQPRFSVVQHDKQARYSTAHKCMLLSEVHSVSHRSAMTQFELEALMSLKPVAESTGIQHHTV